MESYLHTIIFMNILYCFSLAINHLDLINRVSVPGTGSNFFPTARPVFCTLSIQTFRREVDTYNEDL